MALFASKLAPTKSRGPACRSEGDAQFLLANRTAEESVACGDARLQRDEAGQLHLPLQFH